MDTIIGIDIGGTKTVVVEGAFSGAILQETPHPTEGVRPFSDAFPALAATVRETIARARASGRNPIAIGVAAPGPLHASSGVLVDPPNLPGWHGAHLKAALVALFPGLPVCVDHDAKAGALAEWWFGAGRVRPEVRDLIFLVYGTGMGAGIIIDGHLLRGTSETAGEISLLRVPTPEGARIQNPNGWEDVASGRGLTLIARTLYPHRWPSDTSIQTLVDAAIADEPDALAIVAESARWLGSGMALLIDILNPQMIVLGSLGVALGDRLLAPAREVVRRYARPVAVAACEIRPSALGPTLAAVQSLMPALESLSSRERAQRGDEVTG